MTENLNNIMTSQNKLNNGYFNGALKRIKDLQRADGAIAWFEDGVIDPWNHLEATMGLNLCGENQAVARAFEYLFTSQLPDGSWLGQLGSAVPIDETLQNFTTKGMNTGAQIRDTNFTAYIATAVWHDYLLHANMDFLRHAWPHVEAAIGFTLSHQSPHGDIRWAANDPATPEDDALLTGCSSIYKSLEAAILIARTLDRPVQPWQAAQALLGEALRHKPERFDRQWESKARFSMDWYYPVLCGALTPEQARQKLWQRWDEFIVDGHGCRCVLDEPWITIAETAELTLSLCAIGERDKAREVLSWLEKYRDADGAYWMGYQFEQEIFWPVEKPAWTAGAVILATDAVEDLSPASGLFIHQPNS